MHPLDAGTLSAALGHHAFRAQGIDAGALARLGRPNLERLAALLGEAANTFLADGQASREELALARSVREQVEALLEREHAPKPVLPRLRAELFRPGDELAIHVGDTLPGAAHAWVPATVSAVVKSQKPEFTSDVATRGFYWRVLAAVDAPGCPDVLAFSTTEPRVLLRKDLAFLLQAFEDDLHFVATWCANARRDWPPIWALEAGRVDPIPELPLARWLLRASLDPRLRPLRPWEARP